jgi:alanine racemase
MPGVPEFRAVSKAESRAAEKADYRPTWAEIDTSAFSRNIDAITQRLPDRARLIAVLKANAYGHGATVLAWVCESKRVAMIAVAMLEEALTLRRIGITVPILVFGPLDARGIDVAVDNDITVGITGPEELEATCEVARDREVHVHLKLDTGMGRMGIIESELQRAVEMIRATPRLKVDAIYTHFATADEDESFAQEQIANFDRMRTIIDAPLHHLANSAATLRGLVREGDYVRCGVALFGPGKSAPTEPVMRWRSEIMRLKTLPPGYAIGYGATFRTKRESRIATIPVGYADGYSRRLSHNGEMVIRGQRAPIVGRVSMDLVTIDVTDIAGAQLGDECVLLGDGITADDIASRIDTISYDVLCSVSARVPRVFR